MEIYVTATNNYPPLQVHGGKTLKFVVACENDKQAKSVERRMNDKGYFSRIRRSKSKPYYDKNHYATRYVTASTWLKQ